MKKTVLIIMFFFLPLAAFMCRQYNAKTQRAAMEEPYIRPDSAFVSQSQSFANERQWVSFQLSIMPMDDDNMFGFGMDYNVVIKYDGDSSFIYIDDMFNRRVVTKGNADMSYYDIDRLGMIWYYFHPIPFIDTKPYLRLLKSCRKDNDGETPYFRYKSDWSIGDADFMVNAEDNTLYSASNRTSIWNNVYCFHDISFDDRQHYVDSIMAIN